MAILKEKSGLSNDDLRKLRSMHPGMTLDIQVKSPSATKRVRTEFVGMDGTRCIILRHPDEGRWGSMKDAIYADNQIIVRYILEDETGEVIAFKSNILLVATRPSHLLFISFPIAIQNQGLRSDKRVFTRTPVELFDVATNKTLFEGLVLDISSSGCRIGIRRDVPDGGKLAGKTLKMAIKASKEKSYEVKGQVMNQRADETYFYYGIKFEAQEALLTELLSEILIDV
ncbi:flagellar brake protein [Aliiglaciecola sp. CAU 1673]|uniref:flagellar brake protein n=1 Tax=Aliiglaciecola sp. CAU 1673 TaxID=3032595 RepID=UPI0023D9F236|nr:flagellar brake protein [Aliiglaciecola sp. CAU 1673]MDF2177688.1 flagellar brake protein [Aliiglaciecola sp. CAU 1673]